MGAYEIRFESGAAVRAANERELKHGGAFVAGEPPPLFTRVAVELHLPSLPAVEVHGQVVNVMPGGFFVQFEPGVELEALKSAVELASMAPEPVTEPLPEAGAEAEEDEEEERQGPPPPLAGAVKPAWELIDATSGVPLHKQVKELTVSERLKLARAATAPVRALLIRDIEKRVHVPVVKNPKTTNQELVEWSSLPGISPMALKWMSTQKTLIRNRQVQLNLVKNPATPGDVALEMLAMLPQNELLEIARSPKVREAISRAAKKKLMASGVI